MTFTHLLASIFPLAFIVCPICPCESALAVKDTLLEAALVCGTPPVGDCAGAVPRTPLPLAV
jgi:hypothetical protein